MALINKNIDHPGRLLLQAYVQRGVVLMRPCPRPSRMSAPCTPSSHSTARREVVARNELFHVNNDNKTGILAPRS